ncbi:hypothetical protein KIH39_01840 [Telmatocola sphagniphila]|uniref:SPOR domain-containing protein n=1 Tax=Telmatocola sphagniphila TaxID=1123043 RepID=A0A8E6B5U0_9BACT|nr:hypothetical protein [Telmatocola sphagniphila]QVL32685.1 hypothetical protein KIH39_01840 [Telmatocola sphagniphila]
MKLLVVRKSLALGILMAGLLVASLGAPSPAYAQKKAPPKPHVVQKFRIQIRHPRPVLHHVPSSEAAHRLAHHLNRQGWITHIKRDHKGHVVVAKMPRWRNQSIAHNRGAAAGVAHLLRSQGFEVRIIPFH